MYVYENFHSCQKVQQVIQHSLTAATDDEKLGDTSSSMPPGTSQHREQEGGREREEWGRDQSRKDSGLRPERGCYW